MKNKKTAVGAVFLYLLLTAGARMFFDSYANSYNRLNTDKLIPITADFDGKTAEITVAGKSFGTDLTFLDDENKAWFLAYISATDEFRLSGIVLNSLKEKLLSAAETEIFS